MIKKLLSKFKKQVLEDRLDISNIGLHEYGPFKAHSKIGIDLSFRDDKWYEKEVTDKGYSIVGHHHWVLPAPGVRIIPPQDGYIFVCEMNKSWLLFEMKNVEWQDNPREMYFADAMLLEQKSK